MGIPAREQFPAHVGEGTKMILEALEGWRHEDRERQDTKHAANEDRLERIEREMLAMQATFKLAYPDGDADAHRRFHEAIIEKSKQRAKFYQELRTELAKKGLWAVIGLLAIALWAFIKSKVVT